jgi:uncharacterized protein
MELTGEQLIHAARAKVWEALNDPAVLARCITGCESLERLGDDKFEGKVTAKVGPVKASFTGAVTLSNIDPPNGYKLTGEGKGGVAGFAKGGADVKLADHPDGTMLSYAVKASVGGKLAQVGARLIDGVAKDYAEAFFAAFKAEVEGPTQVPAEATPTPASAPTPTPAEAGLPSWAWALGLAVIVGLCTWWFLR